MIQSFRLDRSTVCGSATAGGATCTTFGGVTGCISCWLLIHRRYMTVIMSPKKKFTANYQLPTKYIL